MTGDRISAEVLVAGSQGVVGRAYLDHLAGDDSTQCIGISRRPADPAIPAADQISLDLSDTDACAAQVSRFRDVTHVVYCAVVESEDLVGGWSDPAIVATNTSMLKNLLDAVEQGSDRLRHVTLLQGTKAYGIHLGQIDIPAKESAPRHPALNFYHEQEDLLRRRAASKDWTWTIWRPQTVIGFSAGSPMNILTTVAVYATLMRELGLPLRFPGSSWDSIWQAVDSRLLAKAIHWGGRTAGAANEIFNITNGDCVNWKGLWPAIAECFGTCPGPPANLTVRSVLKGKDEIWQTIVDREGLSPFDLTQLTSPQFADFGFNGTRNSCVSTIKLRRSGFSDCIDTEQMFREWMDELRRRRVVPETSARLSPGGEAVHD